MLAHLTCRNLLAVCSSTIPAANTLLVFAGLESLLPFDHWHLPTALGAAWTRRVAHLCQVHMSFAMCCFFFACTLLKSACCLPERIAPWYSGMEPPVEGYSEGRLVLRFFFHEYGRRVGMVPRSSLKGGKVSRMVEKKTRTTNNKKTTEHKTKKAHRPRLHHHVVFPLC